MTTRDDNPKLHRIAVERDPDGDVEGVRFVCDGDDTAPCHHWPNCDCEDWGDGHYLESWDWKNPTAKRTPAPGHEDVQQAECWIDPWFNACLDDPIDWAEAYHGPEDLTSSDLRDGPVSVEFEGDYMTWEYGAPAGSAEQGVLL